jgi:hypothetical protein
MIARIVPRGVAQRCSRCGMPAPRRRGKRSVRVAGRPARCNPGPVGYYIRFLLEDDRPLSLEETMAGLRAVDPGFALSGRGDLTRGGERLAQLEVSLPGGACSRTRLRSSARRQPMPAGRGGRRPARLGHRDSGGAGAMAEPQSRGGTRPAGSPVGLADRQQARPRASPRRGVLRPASIECEAFTSAPSSYCKLEGVLR